jgi:hypothetical protein
MWCVCTFAVDSSMKTLRDLTIRQPVARVQDLAFARRQSRSRVIVQGDGLTNRRATSSSWTLRISHAPVHDLRSAKAPRVVLGRAISSHEQVQRPSRERRLDELTNEFDCRVAATLEARYRIHGAISTGGSIAEDEPRSHRQSDWA